MKSLFIVAGFILGALARLLLSVNSLFGIWLHYHLVKWWDPIDLIEYTEITILYICAIGGFLWFLFYVIKAFKVS